MLRTKCCHCIGRSARVMLRKSSPFATLLFDLSLEITKEEFASLKLAVSVDRQNIASKKDLRAVNYTADLFRLLEERGIISKTNLDYLTCLLLKLGRKDLVIRIEKYHKYKKGDPLFPRERLSYFLNSLIYHDHRNNVYYF